jgi:hypothetical protein
VPTGELHKKAELTCVFQTVCKLRIIGIRALLPLCDTHGHTNDDDDDNHSRNANPYFFGPGSRIPQGSAISSLSNATTTRSIGDFFVSWGDLARLNAVSLHFRLKMRANASVVEWK